MQSIPVGVAVLFSLAPVVGCAPMMRGPGFLDARTVESATQPSARELEIEIAPAGGGRIDRIAVEHRGAATAPEALRKLAEATYPGSTIVEYEAELYADGSRKHEVVVKTSDGKDCEVSATESGVLNYSECQIPPAEAPAEVRKAVEAAARGAAIVELEHRKGPAWDEFRVKVKDGERGLYLRVKPDGTLISRALRLEAEVLIPLP